MPCRPAGAQPHTYGEEPKLESRPRPDPRKLSSGRVRGAQSEPERVDAAPGERRAVRGQLKSARWLRPDPEGTSWHRVCPWQKLRKSLLNKQMNSGGRQLSRSAYLRSISKMRSSQGCQRVSYLSGEPFGAPNHAQCPCCAW